jgi:hypothetical protein
MLTSRGNWQHLAVKSLIRIWKVSDLNPGWEPAISTEVFTGFSQSLLVMLDQCSKSDYHRYLTHS